MAAYLAPSTIGGKAYLAPLAAPAPAATGNTTPAIDPSRIPSARRVNFSGGTRVVQFSGGTRKVVF